MRLQHIRGQKSETFFISLPIALVRAKQWLKGTKLTARLNRDGDIVLSERPYENPA